MKYCREYFHQVQILKIVLNNHHSFQEPREIVTLHFHHIKQISMENRSWRKITYAVQNTNSRLAGVKGDTGCGLLLSALEGHFTNEYTMSDLLRLSSHSHHGSMKVGGTERGVKEEKRERGRGREGGWERERGKERGKNGNSGGGTEVRLWTENLCSTPAISEKQQHSTGRQMHAIIGLKRNTGCQSAEKKVNIIPAADILSTGPTFLQRL